MGAFPSYSSYYNVVIANAQTSLPSPSPSTTTAAGGGGVQLPITSSADPEDIYRYLLGDPQQGLVEVSREQCFEEVTEKKGIDIVFAIDNSASMEDNDPNNLRIRGVNTFLDKLDPLQDRAGAVSWSGTVDNTTGVTSNINLIKNQLNSTSLSSNTNLDVGLRAAISLLDNAAFSRGNNNNTNNSSSTTSPASDKNKAIIFLTDGIGQYTYSGSFGSLADEANQKGYRIFSVGLNMSAGSNAELALKDMASASAGQYFSSPSAENLQQIFNAIFQTVVVGQEASDQVEIKLNVSGTGGFQQQTFIPMDVVFAIDSSGSMEDNDPDNIRLAAAQAFLNKLDPATRGDQSGVVSWDDDVDFVSPLTSNSEMTNAAILSIDNNGDTNLDTGLNAAISVLDANTRRIDAPSSKAVVFLSDGKELYTPSGSIGSPADNARSKGYRIFSIGLSVEPGSIEEAHLNDMAVTSGGQYYPSPTAENLQAVFDSIFQATVSSTEPANVDVIQVTQNYMEIEESNSSSFSILPSSIERGEEGQTIIKWQNVGQYVGNRDNKLSANETFSVSFSAGVSSSLSSSSSSTNMENVSLRLPVIVEGKSIVKYTDPSGNAQAAIIPQTYINVNTHICEEEQQPELQLVHDTFIVPGSNNGTFGVYEERGSNVFKPDEEIQLYVEYAGITQKPIDDGFGNIRYLTNTTGNFTITDKQGNIRNATSRDLRPFDSETHDGRIINGSGNYLFRNYIVTGSRDPGEYVFNYTITDNLSGKTMGGTLDFIIEEEQQEFRVVFDTFIVPGSNNGTFGVYEERGSNVFKPDEEIQLYVEYAGITQKPIDDGFGNIRYLTNTTGNFTITDKQGNTINATESLSPFDSETRDRRIINGSGSYIFYHRPGFPPLDPGEYVITFSITDNLSGKKLEIAKDIVIANSNVSRNENTGPLVNRG
jgi:Mg-chelatase subunit ChlD